MYVFLHICSLDLCVYCILLYLGTWFDGGSSRFMIGNNDLKGFFRPKLVYDSIFHNST